MKSSIVIILCCLLYASSYGQKWQSLNKGLDSIVYAIKSIPETNVLFVGGSFNNNPDSLNYIAKWDGNEWKQLGDNINAWVAAIAYFEDTVYIGGKFNSTVDKIAKWNGDKWIPVGDFGTNGNIVTLHVHKKKLYAGGYFTTIGGVKANHLAVWDGKEWSALTSGTSGPVYSIETYQDELIVGGHFSIAGGFETNSIAKWSDSTGWGLLKNGLIEQGRNGPEPGYVLGLEVLNDILYVGGTFDRIDSVGISNLACWDGSNWNNPVGKEFKMLSTVQTVYEITKYKNQLIIAVSSFGRTNFSYPNNIYTIKKNQLFRLNEGLEQNVLCIEVAKPYLFAGGHFSSSESNNDCKKIAYINLKKLLKRRNYMQHE